MNLFEKLNRLDDSLVESKRVVKKKKLTESLDNATWNKIKQFADNPETTGLDFAYSGPYADEVAVLYGEAIEEYNKGADVTVEPSASVQAGRGASELYSDDGGYASMDFETECDELLEFARESDSVEEFKKLLLGHIYSFVELLDYDEDDYDDDYEDDMYETLTEDVKDTDYVIALKHDKNKGKYTFFTDYDTMTSNLEKAATYRSKLIAEGDIKYAVDAAQKYGISSYDPLYEDRFSVITVAEAKKLLNPASRETLSRAVHHNPSAQEAAKPIAKEIHEVIKKHDVSLSSFLKLIMEIVKSENPDA